jgi:hypothetical protein
MLDMDFNDLSNIGLAGGQYISKVIANTITRNIKYLGNNPINNKITDKKVSGIKSKFKVTQYIIVPIKPNESGIVIISWRILYNILLIKPNESSIVLARLLTIGICP